MFFPGHQQLVGAFKHTSDFFPRENDLRWLRWAILSIIPAERSLTPQTQPEGYSSCVYSEESRSFSPAIIFIDIYIYTHWYYIYIIYYIACFSRLSQEFVQEVTSLARHAVAGPGRATPGRPGTRWPGRDLEALKKRMGKVTDFIWFHCLIFLTWDLNSFENSFDWFLLNYYIFILTFTYWLIGKVIEIVDCFLLIEIW